MNARGPSRRLRITVVAIIVVFGVAALVTTVWPETGDGVGFPLMLVGYLTSAWLFIRGSAAYDGRERLAWRLIATSFILAAAGILAFGIAFSLGSDLPAFGPLDVFFIVAYITTLAGLWILPHLQGGSVRRMRVFIDGLVGSVSMAVVTWEWFLRDILNRVQDLPTFELLIGSAYPLVDVATLVVVTVVTLRRSTLRFDPRVLLLGAGFVAQAVADLIYLDRGLGQSFADADPVYPLFLLATMGFLAASLTLGSRPPAREYAERRTPWWSMLAPYGAAIALVGMLVQRMFAETRDTQTIEVFVGAVIVVVLIIIRQALAIRETRELVEQQRSALVSSISHELRTPLTAMVGFLDILSDPEQHIEPEVRGEMVGIVNQQATYMAGIVSDLVMLNRAEPDLRLKQKVVDVEAIVRSAVSSLDIDAGPGVSVEVEPGLTGFFDPHRVQQILVNLLTNAARYGGPDRLVVAKRDGNDVILEVHDNGPGVPKRYEVIIWDRFERGSHRYNAGVPGSGIGLAIVAMLTRAHQGIVGYRRSERLGGACFNVTLIGRADTGPAETSRSLQHSARKG